jgi:hypothetical protein
MRQPLRLPTNGDMAPDFSIASVNGGTIRMEEVPKPLLLVFLRHLA